MLAVLYKRRTPTIVQQDDIDVESSRLDDSDDDDDGTSTNDRSKQSLAVTDDEDLIAELSDDYQQLVDKVQTVVKIFKRSQTKNDAALQKCCHGTGT